MKQGDFTVGRINALSDGVFAIAMTLLVLDLKLPPLDASGDLNFLSAALIEQIPRLISWILSFAILCRLWIIHHGLLRTGNTRSQRFMSWNFVFLGVVAFIPFPTSLLSEHYDQALSVFIFSATYAVASLALGAMAFAYRKQFESAGTSSEKIAAAAVRAVAIILVIALISSLLALFRPWLGVLIWAVFPFASAQGSRLWGAGNSPAGDGS